MNVLKFALLPNVKNIDIKVGGLQFLRLYRVKADLRSTSLDSSLCHQPDYHIPGSQPQYQAHKEH